MRQLSYNELLRRLITSGDLNSDEALIATGILTLRDEVQVGWRTLALLERLVGRGRLRPAAPAPGDTSDLVRYMDSSGDYYVLLLPSVDAAEQDRPLEVPSPPPLEPPAEGSWVSRIIEEMERTDEANRQSASGAARAFALVLLELDRWPERHADQDAFRRDSKHLARVLQEQIRRPDWWCPPEEEGHIIAVLRSRETEVVDEETVRGRAEVLKDNVRLSAREEQPTRKAARGLTVSIGFVVYPQDSPKRTFSDIFNCARGALRSAQEGGGDQVVSCKEFRSES